MAYRTALYSPNRSEAKDQMKECKNCGAPWTPIKCKYCGTIYNDPGLRGTNDSIRT